eukprot:124935-Prorocentrum_minimum.AAC.2
MAAIASTSARKRRTASTTESKFFRKRCAAYISSINSYVLARVLCPTNIILRETSNKRMATGLDIRTAVYLVDG